MIAFDVALPLAPRAVGFHAFPGGLSSCTGVFDTVARYKRSSIAASGSRAYFGNMFGLRIFTLE